MSNSEKPRVEHVGDVQLWLEQESSIHMRLKHSNTDPEELSSSEARKLAAILVRLADEIDNQ